MFVAGLISALLSHSFQHEDSKLAKLSVKYRRWFLVRYLTCQKPVKLDEVKAASVLLANKPD